MDVTIPRSDGSALRCYRAGSQGPGVVILHAWWGLNPDIITFVDRLAAEGFSVIAPDLFDGRTATTPEDAEKLVSAADTSSEQILADVKRAEARIREDTGGRVGALGLSFGASYALMLATECDLDAVVLFYGTGELEPADRITAPVLGHFAEDDPYEPDGGDALFAALSARNTPAARHRYPGTGHWFVEPSNPHYQKDQAELAWARTREFLQQHLRA